MQLIIIPLRFLW